MTVAYLVAGILFIMSLRGLSSQETASAGNTYGIVGMVIAIAATLLPSNHRSPRTWVLCLFGAGFGHRRGHWVYDGGASRHDRNARIGRTTTQLCRSCCGACRFCDLFRPEWKPPW